LYNKCPYLKLTYFSSALFTSIEYLNVITCLSSNMQSGCPLMQIQMLWKHATSVGTTIPPPNFFLVQSADSYYTFMSD
jgi:hypothetical protein